MAWRVVVVGGRGYLGSRAVSQLRGRPDVEVVVASRGGERVVDLARPETFSALDDAGVVVNVSSSHAAPPDALARYCLGRGLVLLEASSDRVVVERLLDAHRGRPAEGALVLGAGIFTGVSNALARDAFEALPGADEVVIGVKSSPFSGAGGGTVDLMIDALAQRTRSIRGGGRADDPEVEAGPVLPFASGPRATLHCSFAEPAMVHASTGAANVTMHMAPVPAVLRLTFLALPLGLVRLGAFRAFLRASFGLLRRLLLRRVSSGVGLLAHARRTRDGATVLRAYEFDDGFAIGGAAIAATALALARRAERPRGTFLVDELVPLAPMLDGIRALAPELHFRGG